MEHSLVVRLAAATLLLVAAVAPLSFVSAQSSPGFDTLMDRAYGSFRSAYWYTRTGNLGVAAIEMMTFDQTWASLREAYEASPPETYADDPEWRETLAEIEATNNRALELLNAGDQATAYETIAGLQRLFAELRARNGVVSYSDHVNGYDAVIKRLSAFRAWDKVLDDDDWHEMARLADEAGDAIAALESNAPEALRDNPDFLRTLENNKDALARYREHVADRNERGAKGSIRDLRSAYGLLFLKYG